MPGRFVGAFPEGAHINEDTGRKIAEWVAGGEPVDHALIALKRDAEAAAGEGTAALRTFWRGLHKAQRDRLDDNMLDNLGSIASTAIMISRSANANGATAIPRSSPSKANSIRPSRIGPSGSHKPLWTHPPPLGPHARSSASA